MEKAHTKAAVSVVRRIMDTDPTFHPEHTVTGHWNFFERLLVKKKNGKLTTMQNLRLSLSCPLNSLPIIRTA
jgi:hypothetical protein